MLKTREKLWWQNLSLTIRTSNKINSRMCYLCGTLESGVYGYLMRNCPEYYNSVEISKLSQSTTSLASQ